jgi:hypothetical protein
MKVQVQVIEVVEDHLEGEEEEVGEEGDLWHDF